MKLISHRGNLRGPNPDRENTWGSIQEALDLGFDVEIDVWRKHDLFWLGHDRPQTKIDLSQLNNSQLWIHCKNLDAFTILPALLFKEADINFFWHETDKYTLTSNGWIWTFPGCEVNEYCIAVKPELFPDLDISQAGGICTDYVYKYKELVNIDL